MKADCALMPPMPARFRAIQIAYAKMIGQVQDAILGTRLTPQTALLIAFIGDQELSPSDLQRYGYFIGTKVTYNIEQLAAEHLLERIEGPVSADRRRRPVRLTPAGKRLAAALRVKLAHCQGIET